MPAGEIMKADHRNTLLLPFENGLIAPPGAGEGTIGFFNAAPLPDPEILPVGRMICEQGFRSDYLALTQAGYDAVPEFAGGERFALALVLAGRVRRANERLIARAHAALDLGGTLVVAGAKQAGIAALRKWLASRLPLAGNLAKHHAQVFWLVKQAGHGIDIEAEPDLASGVFSAGKPDAGSALLAAHFDDRISGRVADFGAGWGYLSGELCRKAPAVRELHLYEADFTALQAARTHLGTVAGTGAAFHWHDLLTEPVGARFDWVVMNPPFHAGLQRGATSGRAAAPAIGQKFIKAAAGALVRGGRLLMVANRKLPYEATLADTFGRTRLLEERDGYKVIEAVR